MGDQDTSVSVGQIVTANRDLIDPATGDHPEFIMASKGQQIKIVGVDGGHYQYSAINHAYSPNTFGLKRAEFNI